MPGTGQARTAKQRSVYTDVTAVEGPPAPHPDQVLAFQEIGYDVLGLVTLAMDPGGFEGVTSDYAPGHREEVHMWRVAEVCARTGNILLVAIALVALAWSWALFAASVPWALLWSLGGLVTVVLSLNRFSVRFAYTRWWRPAYR